MSTAFWATAIPLAAVVVLALSALIGFGVALGMRLEDSAHNAYDKWRKRRRPAFNKEPA